MQSKQKMRVADIKIYPCFQETPPREHKMELKERYFNKTGLLKTDIMLDSDNYLIDGYTSYLLAKEHGIEYVPFTYGKRQIVRACHKVDGKLYIWVLPRHLTDKVHVGDRVVVPGNNNSIRVVTVAAVEDCTPKDYANHFRTVIQVKKDSKGVQIPVFEGGGFCDSLEGCTLQNIRGYGDMVDRIQKAFNKLPLCERQHFLRVPNDGEYIARANFWKRLFSQTLESQQCHIAMNRILKRYIRIKKMDEISGIDNTNARTECQFAFKTLNNKKITA